MLNKSQTGLKLLRSINDYLVTFQWFFCCPTAPPTIELAVDEGVIEFTLNRRTREMDFLCGRWKDYVSPRLGDIPAGMLVDWDLFVEKVTYEEMLELKDSAADQAKQWVMNWADQLKPKNTLKVPVF